MIAIARRKENAPVGNLELSLQNIEDGYNSKEERRFGQHTIAG